MNRRLDIMQSLLAAALCVVLSASCSTIDDDLSDCGKEFVLDYELVLVTNMSIELQTKLNTPSDAITSEALRQYLSRIFTDYAHDVDLSFYDTDGDMQRVEHDQHIMNANQASYTIYLPKSEYMHLATANLADNTLVELTGDEHCPTSKLVQTTGDTIAPHNTGLFTARLPMQVLSVDKQRFHVNMYIANCAEALVIDPRGQDIRDIKVFATGFATQFNIRDSSFVFASHDPIVRADKVHRDGDSLLCYCAVNFPSHETPLLDDTRSVVETEDPFVTLPGSKTLWQLRVYVTMLNGSTTETVLSVNKSSRAGQLTVIKGYITEDGAVHTNDETVGVSVTLDWHQGMDQDVPL